MPKLSCIILVDDDSTTNYLNHSLLLRLEAADRLLTATNGQHALDLLHQHQPTTAAPDTLILLDVQMPVMDGYSFVETYAQLPASRHSIIVVTLTTPLPSHNITRLKQHNVAGFVHKPLTTEKVHQLLKTYFSHLEPDC
ncbi:response regulator [Hymenobacter sediminicola]|uniref:Response regulator n=1 Tax=Hymenobacter sediminicola TaxID=2761579 RepID=A0A7G7W3B1_9BACT|nr:response regulator [Hymenobacter sediminicola]QNH60854.1 response regulator [Hymenobacter sediminicola]